MLSSLALSFTAIFVALDIVGALPMYLSMTHEMEENERRKIVDLSMLVAFLVALFFAFLGSQLFQSLGIALFDFKIAGGLVLLLLSLADLAGGPETVKQKPAFGSTGIVPLAVPLITGPGVLTQVVLQVGTNGYAITLAALVLNYVLAWLLLRYSAMVTRLIGKEGTVVISKIGALLLAAIAVAMMRSGIFEAIEGFRS